MPLDWSPVVNVGQITIPFSGFVFFATTGTELSENLLLALCCIRDCAYVWKAPVASHCITSSYKIVPSALGAGAQSDSPASVLNLVR